MEKKDRIKQKIMNDENTLTWKNNTDEKEGRR